MYAGANRPTAVLLGAGLLAAVCVAAAAPSRIDQPVGRRFVERLHRVSEKTVAQVAPSPSNALRALAGAPAYGRGKPGILYVGGDFCPYCAALRWPLVLALLRFGELHGLRYMRSSHADVYPDTPTFSFYRSSFRSAVVAFDGIEAEDRAHKALEPLEGQALAVFNRFDAKPYTEAESAIPFLYLDGKYGFYGAPFSPHALEGRDWRRIVDTLSRDPQAKLSQDIVGATNLLTAAMCRLTHGRPTRICEAAGVAAAAKSLPAAAD